MSVYDILPHKYTYYYVQNTLMAMYKNGNIFIYLKTCCPEHGC